MEKFNYIVISQESRETDGNISLINIFNGVIAERLPVAVPTFWVTANFETTDQREHNCRIAITKTSDSLLIGESVFNSVKTEDQTAHEIQLRSDFSNIVFDQTGEYRATLYVDGNEVGFRKIFVESQN
jgi:hypothetical protein